MNIKELAQNAPQTLIIVSAAELQEFGRELLAEAQKSTPATDGTKWQTVEEFCGEKGINRTTAIRWAKAGIIARQSMGGRVYYSDK